MNSVIRKNRDLLKNKSKFRERNPIPNKSKKTKLDQYEIREISFQEKTKIRHQKKMQDTQSIIIKFLIGFLLVSIFINIYLAFIKSDEIPPENLPLKRLEEMSADFNKSGELFRRIKNWSGAIDSYKLSIENDPSNFDAHQKLLFVLTEKCKEDDDYQRCLEAKEHANKIKKIFIEEEEKLDEIVKKINKIKK
tara:strand:+ start:5568 stop:6146 length:579 start_codon:yes stop_codon:yes gene_type:complete